MEITPEQREQIAQAEVGNVLKKVKAGKVLTKAERQLLEDATQAPPAPPKPQKRKGSSPNHVIENRIKEMVARISGSPTVHTCELHTEFCASWNCHWRTVDRILVRARAYLLDQLKRSKEDFRCESLAFYQAKLTDPKATTSEQLRARQRIDELLGLDAPKQTEISGRDGAALNTAPIVTIITLPDDGSTVKEGA
jgi:hypothetical protein